MRDGLAARPSLPPVAVPLTLGLILGGLLLALLGPAWKSDPRRSLPLTAWLVAAPLLPIVAATRHLLLPMPASPDLQGVPLVPLVLGGVLMLGSFCSALVPRDLVDRLLAAVPGHVGLTWLALAVLVPDDAVRAGTTALMIVVLSTVAVLVLLPSRRSLPGRLAITLLLLQLAAVPPMVSWRPRFAQLEALLSGDELVACLLLSVGILLGYVVYLRPLPDLWRGGGAGAEESQLEVSSAGRVAAWIVLALVLAWGLGLARSLPG